MGRGISGVHNVSGMQRLANRALPAPILNYMEGGADDEVTMRRNGTAFDEWALSQNALVDVSSIDTRTDLLGFQSSLPLILSPTGMSRLFHHSGEMAVAGAAAVAGVPYGLSTMATTSIEAVATSGAMRYFQLYIFRDRGLTKSLLERAAAAGYSAIALTTDTAVAGNRERDLRTGMVIPPRFGLRSLASFAGHPRWSLGALRSRSFDLANVSDHVGKLASSGTSVISYVNRQFDRTATWQDLEWLRSHWKGDLVVKGLTSPADCATAASCGANAIMISNHGGRQLDGMGSPLDYLPAIRDRIQNAAQLIVDGGVMRGTHVLKAIALGANGCAIGRPYLYGLASSGQDGVARILSIFKTEIERGMALMGRTRISDISASDICSLNDFRRRPIGIRHG